MECTTSNTASALCDIVVLFNAVRGLKTKKNI